MIKVSFKADSKYPIDRRRLRQMVIGFLTTQGVESDLEVGVVIVGDRKMRELNQKFHKTKGTTDVLSFSQAEMADNDSGFVEPQLDLTYLGDIVVSWPQAVKQAIERNLTVDDEIDFLVAHGLLHLLGIHHD